MIHIELSVPPHHHTDPPHVIFAVEFRKVDEALEWCRHMSVQTDSRTHEDVLKAAANEYVQVELDMLERTGTEYVAAVLSIEGEES